MIDLDLSSPVPPFEQVRSQLAQQIGAGVLPVGTRLPTVRRLASDLGLAVNTVARAYRELEHSRLIETRGRAGTFVSAGGDRSMERAQDAAQHYARTVLGLGIGVDAAVEIVRAALAAVQPGLRSE